MTPEEMACLHARAFAGQGRAWQAAEFARLVDSPHVIVTGTAQSFALGRVAADEAELVTIATDPDLRRRGLARAALEAMQTAAAKRGAGRIFLEVAFENHAARAFYDALGYREVARRGGYYTMPDGTRQDALVLKRHLGT